MKNKPAVKKPTFQVDELVQLSRYLPPLLSGTVVRVIAVQPNPAGCRYQVGPAEYEGGRSLGI
jgi:hypothetical protein